MRRGRARRRAEKAWDSLDAVLGEVVAIEWEGSMVRIIGMSGSLRSGSFNAALLRAAVELAPEGTEIAVETIRGVPLYDGDVEKAEGIPAEVVRLKDAVAAADGLLLVTPEYNNSIPGVFKNAIDWMTRPPADIARVWGGKPVAVIGASPGGFGTILSQNAWWPVLRTLRADPWFGGRLMLARAGDAFAEGRLASEEARERLKGFVEGFAAYVAERAR
jgi:NAD(P)H-dependent FMN reductase